MKKRKSKYKPLYNIKKNKTKKHTCINRSHRSKREESTNKEEGAQAIRDPASLVVIRNVEENPTHNNSNSNLKKIQRKIKK